MKIEPKRMEVLVQAQLDAYNQREIEKFCACYHADVVAYSLPGSETICRGLAEFRKRYADLFAKSPALHCDLQTRIVLENSVLDEESVTGRFGAEQKRARVVAIYFFKDDLIHEIYFTK